MEKEQHLEGLSRRDILEQQDPAILIELRSQMLSKLSDLERDIHLVNDVIEGAFGLIPFPSVAGVYDADDGTTGAKERPDDRRWAVVTIPNNIELGQE